MSSIYSTAKPVWHLDRIEDLRNGKQPMPVHVQLILSDLCNQDCSFCAYRMSSGLSRELFATAETHNPNRQIPLLKAIEIVDDCEAVGVKAIQFTGGGEPTVHKSHLQIFDRAQRAGIDTALVTNGIRMDPGHDAIQRMQWIRISVDAGTEATYCKVRRVQPAHWRKVWSNMGSLAVSYEGTLGCGFVVTPENYREIAECAYLAREHGASSLRIGAVFSSEGIGFYKDLIEAICDEIERAQVLSSERFEVIDLFGRRLADLEHGAPSHPFCGYQYLTVYIGGDLSVYRCCNTAYTEIGKVGSLVGQRFRDLPMDYGDFDARGCRYCQFLQQNDAINALIDPPTHVNFV